MMEDRGINTEPPDNYKRYELLRVGQWILILIILLVYTLIYLTSVVYDDFLRQKGCTNNTLRLPIVLVGEINEDEIQDLINKLFRPELCELLKNVTDLNHLDDIEKFIKQNDKEGIDGIPGNLKVGLPGNLTEGLTVKLPTQKPEKPENPAEVNNRAPVDNSENEQNPESPDNVENLNLESLKPKNYQIARKAPKYLENKNCTEAEFFKKIGECLKLELSSASLIYLGIFTMFLIATVDIIGRATDEPVNKFPLTILLLLSCFFSLNNAYMTLSMKFSWFHPLLVAFAVLNLVLFGFFLTGFIKAFCGVCCGKKRNRRVG